MSAAFDPWGKTAQPLDEIANWLSRYIVTVSADDIDLLTLWCAHTHVVVETYTTPRLLIDSPVPESGKTTCLEHLQRLCHAPVQMASLSSPALLTRMLDERLRTLLIDEADRSLHPKREGTGDLLSVLNSGYKRGATRPVLVPGKGNTWISREMPTFAPVAMAGNSPHLPDDVRSRAIRVLLLPDLDGTAEESDWELIEPEALDLAARLAAWADAIRDRVRTDPRPTMPAGIVSRFREKWQPLRRVADQAGGRWPHVVDQLAIHDREQALMDKEDGLIRERPHVLLLRHLWQLWPDDRPFMPTEHLLADLAARYPDTWGSGGPFDKPLTAQRLGRMLAQGFKINSTRPEQPGPRGYHRRQFERVWSRLNLTDPGPSDLTAPATRPAIAPALQPLPTPASTEPPRCQRCRSTGGRAGLGASGYCATCEQEQARR